jgi:hypothetical protein
MNAAHGAERLATDAPTIPHHPSQRGMTMFGAYVIKQYERAVLFKLGKVKGRRANRG